MRPLASRCRPSSPAIRGKLLYSRAASDQRTLSHGRRLSKQHYTQQTQLQTLARELPAPPSTPEARPIDLKEQLIRGLRSLHAERDVEVAWQLYRLLVVSAREEDSRRLARVERVLEHLEDPEPSFGDPIPRRLRLLSEDLRAEYEEAWARQLGRTLVENLKRSALSLRVLADRVGVSAPYLSQLSAGGGPVPSDRILAKLREGHEALELPVPSHEPPPSRTFQELESRSSMARDQLKLAPIAAYRPRVTVDHPPSRRLERALRDCFEAIAERYVDEVDGPLIKELVEQLVSADQALLASLAWVARDEEGSVNALHTLRTLSPEVRHRFIDLLNAVSPNQSPVELQNRAAKKDMP